LPEVLDDAFISNELEKLKISLDDFGQLSLGKVPLAKVGFPPAKHLEREDMKL